MQVKDKSLLLTDFVQHSSRGSLFKDNNNTPPKKNKKQNKTNQDRLEVSGSARDLYFYRVQRKLKQTKLKPLNISLSVDMAGFESYPQTSATLRPLQFVTFLHRAEHDVIPLYSPVRLSQLSLQLVMPATTEEQNARPRGSDSNNTTCLLYSLPM